MLRSLLLLTSVALVAGTAMADVYKYTDEKGNIQYTDKPPSLPAERLNVQSQKTDMVAVQARQAEEQQRQANNAQQSARNRADTADRKEATELTAKDKAERCAKSRERYDKYMNSQKLYEQDEKSGERRYLSSEEIDVARASAKASMEVLCK